MPAPFPHRYDVDLTWDGLSAARVTAGVRPAIHGGAPAEFDGSDEWWSPEHLLLSSLSLCLMATFQAVSRRAALRVRDYSCRGEAVLDRTMAGLGFTFVSLAVSFTVPPGEGERARGLMLKAKQHCVVANSLMPPVHLELSVRETTRPPGSDDGADRQEAAMAASVRGEWPGH